MLEMSAKSESPHFFAATHHTLDVSDSMALRVYSNTNPQNMKTADMQKGLILSFNGIDVIGEGTGFGVPIAKYSDETVFSGSSTLHVCNNGNTIEIRKEFLMNLVARDSFRNLKLENSRIRKLFDHISALAQRHKRLARSILIVKGLATLHRSFSLRSARSSGHKCALSSTISGGELPLTHSKACSTSHACTLSLFGSTRFRVRSLASNSLR